MVRILLIFKEHCKPIRDVEFDSVNNHLIIASDDLHISFYDTINKKVKHTLVSHTDIITRIKCVGNIFISASIDGVIKIWDTNRILNGEIQNIKINKEILDLSISNNGKEFIVGTSDGCEFYVDKSQ